MFSFFLIDYFSLSDIIIIIFLTYYYYCLLLPYVNTAGEQNIPQSKKNQALLAKI